MLRLMRNLLRFMHHKQNTQNKKCLQEKFKDIEFEEDETTWIPQIYVELTDEDDIKKYERFKEMMDEIDDVQDV